jgi:Na+-driven multidrug efflux pump
MSPDPEVIAYSMQKMMIISSTYFICGINEVMCSTMRGMGKPIISMVLALVYTCALRFVWVYVIFPLCPNLTFLYLVWPIGWVLSIVTILFFYFPHVKKLEKMKKVC